MSDDKLSSALRDLRAATKALNDLADDVNHTFKSVEASLTATGVGIRINIPLGDLDEVEYRLGYTKLGASWRIVIGQMDTDENDELVMTYRGWEHSPRDVKIFAIGGLPRLIAELQSQSNRRVAAAQEAISQIRESLSTDDGE